MQHFQDNRGRFDTDTEISHEEIAEPTSFHLCSILYSLIHYIPAFCSVKMCAPLAIDSQSQSPRPINAAGSAVNCGRLWSGLQQSGLFVYHAYVSEGIYI